MSNKRSVDFGIPVCAAIARRRGRRPPRRTLVWHQLIMQLQSQGTRFMRQTDSSSPLLRHSSNDWSQFLKQSLSIFLDLSLIRPPHWFCRLKKTELTGVSRKTIAHIITIDDLFSILNNPGMMLSMANGVMISGRLIFISIEIMIYY